jgi:hypothetical protein
MPLSEQDHKDKVGKDNENRASYGVGSTTQGGSNFGQGSSNLGANATTIHQGAEANKGANYENEKDRLGNSSTGTSNEGSSSPEKGAANSGQSDTVKENSKKGQPGWNGEEERNDTRRKQDITPEDESRPKEGDRRDTSDQTPGYDVRFRQNYRPDSRGWSQSSMEEN